MGPTLAEVGEGETLKRIFPRLPHADAELLGPGDDSAVVAAPDGRFAVTTDLMVHGPDFRSAWSSAHDLGVKAAMTNLADVAAMGARPTALVVALAAPLDTPVDVLLGIADGLRDGCGLAAPGCGVVGGDLSASPALMIAVTAFGDLEGRAPVTRSGARPGDQLAVAGDLGRAGAGLWLLFRDGVAADGTPDAARAGEVRAAHPELVAAQLAPVVPIALGVPAALGGATAMLDVSDGLVLDARRLAVASGCSVELDPAAVDLEARALVALDPAVGDRAASFVLAGGEDHALLATFPPGPLPEGFRRIGAVLDRSAAPEVLVGATPYAELGGWDPYAGWTGAAG
ncbi:thiamine-phosphate kinase [Herbiconiux sp. CPCC 205716]|uniref:Thiamine-monophosphate kinase n=1 Tax=Herbiconiux gentiana TaxID=2970912 RepID=A0ABT2GGS2_9MICO|nr:thiamine-phosphate kinase [Herbiconiux gentiana]MCS5715417.1 thiamine-phosphate kinase [Herbiconiux gentiana]